MQSKTKLRFRVLISQGRPFTEDFVTAFPSHFCSTKLSLVNSHYLSLSFIRFYIANLFFFFLLWKVSICKRGKLVWWRKSKLKKNWTGRITYHIVVYKKISSWWFDFPTPFPVSVTLSVLLTHTQKKKKLILRKIETLNHHSNFTPPPHSLLVYLNWGVSFPPFCSISCLKYLQIDISSSPTTSCAFFVCAAFVILSLAKKRKTKMWNLLTFLFLLFIVGFFSLRLSPPPPSLEWLYSFLSLNFFFSVVVLYTINFQSLLCKYRMSPVFITWKLIKHFHNNKKYWNNN